MSTITVKIQDASVHGRDDNGTWSKKVEITPEQFLLAFQGAQAALPTIEAMKPAIIMRAPAIQLEYTLDPKMNRYVWLRFEIAVDNLIFSHMNKIEGVCTSPKSIENIAQSITEAYSKALEAERNHRIARVSIIEDMMLPLPTT